VFVDDVVQGITTAARAELPAGAVLDLGSGSLVSIADLATQIADLMRP